MSNSAYIEASEKDKIHFIDCVVCGEKIDCRNLDEVFQHEDHKPHPDIPYSGSRSVENGLNALAQRLEHRHRELFKYCNGNPDAVFGGCLAAMKELIQAIHTVLSASSRAKAGVVTVAEINRPDWEVIYGYGHSPCMAQELISVTRHTAFLAMKAIEARQEHEFYHNRAAACRELREAIQNPSVKDQQ